MYRNSSKRGMTLIELLVVIAVIAILAAILVPTVNVAIQKTKVTAVEAQISGLLTALEAYKTEYGVLPLNKQRHERPFYSGSDFEKPFLVAEDYEYDEDSNILLYPQNDVDLRRYRLMLLALLGYKEDPASGQEIRYSSSERILNPKEIPFLNAKNPVEIDGNEAIVRFLDPWNRGLGVIMDNNYDGKIRIKRDITPNRSRSKEETVTASAVIYSLGPDPEDPTDDIYSYQNR